MLVPGLKCEGACAGSHVQAPRVGTAWDVSCILVLTWVRYRMLQCPWAEMGGLTLTLSLCVCVCTGFCPFVSTSLRAPPSTLSQRAFILPISDPERGAPRPRDLPVPGIPQYIPQLSGQRPSCLPPELQVRVAAGGREEREREEGQPPQHL